MIVSKCSIHILKLILMTSSLFYLLIDGYTIISNIKHRLCEYDELNQTLLN